MNKSLTLTYRPVDRWHFSSGRPFDRTDEGFRVSETDFPPLPTVTSGAFRSLLQNRVEFSKDLRRNLVGDGLWDTGDMSFTEVCVSIKGSEYLPSPSILTFDIQNDQSVIEFVGERQMSSDITFFDKPFGPSEELSAKSFQPSTNWVEKQSLLEAFAAKSIPASRISDPSTWVQISVRLGVSLSGESKTTQEGELYAAHDLWPSGEVALVQRVTAHAPASEWLSSLVGEYVVPFGSRGHSACLQIEDSPSVELEVPQTAGFYFLSLVSPSVIGVGAQELISGPTWPGLSDCEILAASMGRAVRTAMWDYRKGRQWCWVVPAGATFLIKVRDGARAAAHFKQYAANFAFNSQFAKAARLGFGRFVLHKVEG